MLGKLFPGLDMRVVLVGRPIFLDVYQPDEDDPLREVLDTTLDDEGDDDGQAAFEQTVWMIGINEIVHEVQHPSEHHKRLIWNVLTRGRSTMLRLLDLAPELVSDRVIGEVLRSLSTESVRLESKGSEILRL